MLIGRRGLFQKENLKVWNKILAGALIAFFPLYGLGNMLPAFIVNKSILTPLSLIITSLSNFSFMLVLVSGVIFAFYNTNMHYLLMKITPQYSLSDIVGKAGIEQSMDNVLQGKKGETTVYVDNLGRVTDTVSRKDPEAGNDVYLTIDKNLQESTYKLLEEKIAGIVLSKLQNVLEYDTSSVDDSKNLIIPVSDAYYNLIGNAVIDSGHFSSSDAKTAEQQVYSIFRKRRRRRFLSSNQNFRTHRPAHIQIFPMK